MWFLTCMDFGMAFQVMLTNKAFVAVVAAPLTVSKVSLHMRADVLLSAKEFPAAVVCAHVLVIL